MNKKIPTHLKKDVFYEKLDMFIYEEKAKTLKKPILKIEVEEDKFSKVMTSVNIEIIG